MTQATPTHSKEEMLQMSGFEFQELNPGLYQKIILVKQEHTLLLSGELYSTYPLCTLLEPNVFDNGRTWLVYGVRDMGQEDILGVAIWDEYHGPGSNLEFGLVQRVFGDFGPSQEAVVRYTDRKES